MEKKFLKIAIAGAGNIGEKRAAAITELGQDKVFGVFDVNQEKAKSLANTFGAKVYANWKDLLKDPEVDAVIIATTTEVNVKMAIEALNVKKHVLGEKPLGSSNKESWLILKASKKNKRILKVGFNHRHHPAIMKAYELMSSGAIGKPMFIRSVYGHGARPGYDTEWRMNKKFSAGGELFDQGVHIIDLANWFLGGFSKAFGQTKNYYWKKSNLEDNAFCQLTTKKDQIVSFHVSLTQWRNKFTFEIFGDKGYLFVNGLGKSYGVETLIFGTEVGQGKVPNEQVFEFPGEDISWKDEWKEFRNAVLENRQPLASAKDNVAVNSILESLYLSAKTNKIIKIKK